MRMSSRFPSWRFSMELPHAPNELRPGRRCVSRRSAKSLALERAINLYLIVRGDGNGFAVLPSEEGEQVKLGDRIRRHVIDAAQLGTGQHVFPDHARELHRWQA